MRLVFLGTPDFAVPSLSALHAAHHVIPLVLCRPDRRAGRGLKHRTCPVKVKAHSLGLEVFQPARLDRQAIETVEAQEPEVGVVVAYGHLLPREMLRVPPHGWVNLHASLLPRFRGAAPIVHSILGGDRSTGVTTMLMDEGLDTGPIFLQEELAIDPEETAGDLEAKLAWAGATLLVTTLARMEEHSIRPSPQIADRYSYAPKLAPNSGSIHWERPAEDISRQVRALNPRPGAFTLHNGKIIKIWRVKGVSQTSPNASPGTLVEARGGSFHVVCGQGTLLEPLEIQKEGHRRVTPEEALRGRWFALGDRFIGQPGELKNDPTERVRSSS